MEFAMREWLTVIIVLLIMGVLLDGWRRMRQARQQSLKMSLSMHKGIDKEELESYGSELPGGGARVVGHRDENDARDLTRTIRDGYEQNRNSNQPVKTALKPPRVPEQVVFNLEENVPMLMEAFVEGGQEAEQGQETKSEREAEPSRVEPSFTEVDVTTPGPATKPSMPASAGSARSKAETEEVLIINVMAAKGTRFQGEALLDIILECGMRYGDMQIFHRHADIDGNGALWFSMVNMVVPGSFDLNNMGVFETPGVSLFLTLPIDTNSIEAFNNMADTAKAMAECLGGELKDENRSVMTAQTLEHCRQRIREFERKQLV